MRKIIISFVCALLVLLSVTGCASGGIEGMWILTSESLSDGTELDAKGLKENGISETYVISGEKVEYTCEFPGLKKPIDIEFELKDLGKNKYSFCLPGGLEFATVEVRGNTMTYRVGEDDDYSIMVFKRQ